MKDYSNNSIITGTGTGSGIVTAVNNKYNHINNPILTCHSIHNKDAIFVADPFLFIPSHNITTIASTTSSTSTSTTTSTDNNKLNNNWYIFFEMKNNDNRLKKHKGHTSRQGQIGVAISKDYGITWKYIDIILSMSYHLSYPNVFEYENNIYMMTDSWNSLQLFKSTPYDFPMKWTPFKQLHDNRYIDPSMIYFNNTWWLFVNIEQYMKYIHLHILYSTSPIGPWVDTSHNCHMVNNPHFIENTGGNSENGNNSIYMERYLHSCVGGKNIQKYHKTGLLRRNSIGTRSGGRPFIYNNTLYRVVQNSEYKYGDSIDIYEVISLSKDHIYKDKLVKSFRDQLRRDDNIGTL